VIGNDSDCGHTFSSCRYVYDRDQAVSLTASPDPGFIFTGWNGVCTGTDPVCDISISRQIRSVWASFSDSGREEYDTTWYPLAVHRSGNRQGVVTSGSGEIECGNDCDCEDFETGETVTLTAQPEPGHRLAGWSGACAGADPVCEVTMDQARTVTATFTAVIPEPPVPINPPNDNTAICDPVTGKLKIRLKCPVRRLRMAARVVTGKGKRAKQMSKGMIRVRNRKAGKWKFATLVIKPKFHKRVANMGKVSRKTLWARIRVTWKGGKAGKVRRSRTIHHHYRVMVR